MAKFKKLGKKKRLARALKQNVPVPIWVVAKTLGKVRGRIIRRHWRRSRMQL